MSTSRGTRVDPSCRLCRHGSTESLDGPDARRYRRCARCGLVFVERVDLPAIEAEAAHYRTHDNRPDDPRYRAFLGRIVAPLARHLRQGMVVLDFGSGSGSPVSDLFERRGVQVVEYDPVFRPERAALERRYDAIVASEVIEHFHEPAIEFARLDRLLKPDARLGVMTQRLEDRCDFRTWWYARDPTHVAFYGTKTMSWIAAHFAWRRKPVSASVTLFRKP